MKKLLMTTAAMVVLSGSAAFAFGDVVLAPPAKEKPDRGNGTDDHPFPFDAGRANQSPIRGRGAIKVVHNEPAPGNPDAEITRAIQLLQDNGYRIFKRREN